MTTNHEYNTPQEGTTDWHIPLNENFEQLDADVEIRDAAANRGSYTPRAGAKFLATDTGAIYLGDGEEWAHVGDLRYLGGNVFVQSDQPAQVSQNDIWVNPEARAFAVYDEGSWIDILGNTSDGTSDGSGGSTTIVEDGEGDLSAYGGDSSYYSITTDAISGAGSIVAIDAEKSAFRTIASTDGLTNYPRPGDTFRFDVSVDTKNTYGGVLWGVQSESSPWPGYRLRIDTGASPGVELEKVTTSEASFDIDADSGQLSYTEVEPVVGTVYRVEVEWNEDGTMPFTVTDTEDGSVLVDEQSPVADTAYTEGGVGFMSSRSWSGQSEAKARFDNFEII